MILEVVIVVLSVGALIENCKDHGIELLGTIALKQHVVSTRSGYPVSQNWGGVANFPAQLRDDARTCVRDIQTMVHVSAENMREHGIKPRTTDMMKLSVLCSFCDLIARGGKQASSHYVRCQHCSDHYVRSQRCCCS